MLLHLHVRNLALIEEAEVDFSSGLNILTGETGAGKSILLGSMQLILGGKVSKAMIRKDAPFALIELLFQVEDSFTAAALEAMGVTLEDGQLLLSRKITEGRSINKINQETVTISRMKEAASLLLDIHGQHEHQSLLYPDKQLEILDAFGKEKIMPARETAAEAFAAYRDICTKIKALDLDEEQRNREISYLEYETEQIAGAALKEGEDEDLEARFRLMSNSRRITEDLEKVSALIGGAMGDGAASGIGEADHLLRSISGLDSRLASLSESITEIDSLLGDFSREVSIYLDQISFDEEEYEKLTRRLDLINDMKSRYGQSIAQIKAYGEKQQRRLEDLYSFEDKLSELKEKQAAARKELENACRTLSGLRQEAAQDLTERVKEGLKDLNFLDVDFSVAFSKKKSFTASGYDDVVYLISTNPGESVKPLGEIVSGGELSRIMLALKALLADKDHIETLIFDEIDTGISGRTAQKVSEKMAVIGRTHQVLCITHLPQIAAQADVHFAIEKVAEKDSTKTMIHELDEEASIRELARLLGGVSITDAVLQNAREMKALAKANAVS